MKKSILSQQFSNLGMGRFTQCTTPAVKSAIDDDVVRTLCPSIIQSPVVCQIDGETVPVPNYQILVADYRTARPDLVEKGMALVPRADWTERIRASVESQGLIFQCIAR